MNKILFFLFLVFGTVVFYGNASTAEEMRPLTLQEQQTVSGKLSKVARNTSSISSSFTQLKNINVLSEKIKSTGKFYFKKDNVIRWEYIRPYRYILIFNGSKVFINDGGKTNRFDANANRIFQQINSTILASMKGVVTETPDFAVSYFRLRNRYIVKLVPKSDELLKYISAIEIYFDNRNYSVAEVNLYEKSGDYTNIVFTNREFNRPLPDSLFNPGN